MSSVVLERVCRICTWASFTWVPAIFSLVAWDVRRLLQFTQGNSVDRAAGLISLVNGMALGQSGDTH